MQHSNLKQQFTSKFLSLLIALFILTSYVQTSSVIGKEAIDGRNIFVNFQWLTSIIDVNNCGNNKATVYDSGQYYFVWVETATSKALYFQDGTPYCKETPKEECLKEYQLNEVELDWSCASANTGASKPGEK